jgi:membrane protein involved in colicin uptake
MFPMTITLTTPAQLNAVLLALQPNLQASDFKSPVVGAAYEEAKERVRINEEINPTFGAAVKAAREAEAKAAAGKSGAATADTAPSAAEGKTPAAAALAKKDAETAAELGADAAAPATTYEDVKKAILEVSKVKGRDAAIKLLGKFGAEKGPDLQSKPETFSKFVAAAKELLS